VHDGVEEVKLVIGDEIFFLFTLSRPRIQELNNLQNMEEIWTTAHQKEVLIDEIY